MENKLQERLLLRQLKEGHKEAFEWLFKTYYQGLCRKAYLVLGDAVQAENVVSQLFCDLYESHRSINITTNLEGYLFTSVHRRALNIVTRNPKRAAYAEVAHMEDNGDRPDLYAEAQDLNGRLEQALATLPGQCRKIFLMNRWEKKKYREIADELDLSMNTVETQMSRALARLRVALKDFLILVPVLFLEIYEKMC